MSFTSFSSLTYIAVESILKYFGVKTLFTPNYMPRQLRYHEQKLLKHSNLYDWEVDRTDEAVMGKYGIRKRSQLIQYRSTARKVRQLTDMLSELRPDDKVRIQITQKLALLLYELGLSVNQRATLNELKDFKASNLMSRRLPVVLVEQNMAPTIDAAVNFIEHGHVKLGPQVVTEINYHVKKGNEDHLGWVKGSAIEKKVSRYNDEVDELY